MPMPGSIFIKVFGSGIACFGPHNNNKFVEFTEPHEIRFFKSLDWIIDYNEVKDLSEEEAIELGQSIANEKNNIAEKFNSMSPEEKEENMDMVAKCELLDYKMYSLRDVIWFKQGRIQMELPEGIDSPTKPEQKKGIRKLIRTIFDKKS